MCTDIDRIGEFICSFHGNFWKIKIFLFFLTAFWGMPMDFIIALYLIYKEVSN